MLDWIVSANDWLNGIVWGWPMLFLILGSGIWLSLGTKGTQFHHFGYIMRNTIGRMFEKVDVNDKGAVSPFQALTTALAATVGTGNIAGVVGAIALGGPGAVFWMWLSALLGMCTKYSEIVLSIRYRERDALGDWVGGPMYYIKNGLSKKWRWLGILFAVFGALAAFGIGNIAQINTIAISINTAINYFIPSAAESTATINLVIGLVVAVMVGAVLLGGLKRIGKVTETLVPVMSGIYILGALWVVLCNLDAIGGVFASIFRCAFDPEAVLGGAAGIGITAVMKSGISRGVFSNEAGLGSAPIAHAAANTDSPVRQGFYGVFEVFASTIVICTLTALTVLVSGVIGPEGTAQFAYGDSSLGANVSIAAFTTAFGGGAAGIIIALGITMFALSTLMTWSLYGLRCFEYLAGSKPMKFYLILFIIVIVIGATMDVSLVWSIADTLNGLMAIPNMIAILALSKVVFSLTHEFFSKKKQ